jgi:hypothetical protein
MLKKEKPINVQPTVVMKEAGAIPSQNTFIK